MRHFFYKKKRNKKKIHLLSNLIGLYVCFVIYFGYVTFMQQIPDQIYLRENDSFHGIFPVPVTISEVQTKKKIDTEETASSLKELQPDGVRTQGNEGQRNGDSHNTYTILCRLFGIFPTKEVQVSVVPDSKVYVSGKVIGIYGQTNGVLVLGTSTVKAVNGLNYTPAENKLKSGDYIISVNKETIETKEDLINQINKNGEKVIDFGVVRDGSYIDVAVTPIPAENDKWMIGVWVKDDMAGIGTLTYYAPDKQFGALGHGVGDGETGALLSLSDGRIYHTELTGIQKGEKGTPGELEGLIYYSKANKLGEVDKNSELGIYGTLDTDDYNQYSQEDEQYEVGFKQEIKRGPARIVSDISGTAKSYDIEITSVNMDAADTNRGITFQVTDETLLNLTGGIVQGMSGSPIIQNGKLVGAVTHVFVNDPTSGYGIFLETMLGQES